MAWEGIYLKVDWVIHIINVIHVILFFRRRVTGWRCLCALNMCWRCSCLSLGGARASPFRFAPGFDVSRLCFFCTSCFLHDCFEPAVPSESWSVGIVERGNGVKVRDRRRCVWLWVKPELLSLSAMQFSPTNGDFTFVSSTDSEGTVVKGPKASTLLCSEMCAWFTRECSWLCLCVLCTQTLTWDYNQICEWSNLLINRDMGVVL